MISNPRFMDSAEKLGRKTYKKIQQNGTSL